MHCGRAFVLIYGDAWRSSWLSKVSGGLRAAIYRVSRLLERVRTRPVVELHAELEAHLGEQLLDLFERLAAEVLGLQHLGLGLLHELADVLDVGVLQAVGGTNAELEL